MKKLFPLFLFLSLVLSACSNSLNSPAPKDKTISGMGKVYINLNGNFSDVEKNLRTIGPLNVKPFTEVEEWKITFTREDFVKEFNSSVRDSNLTEEFLLPIGNGYKVHIEGSVTSDPTQIYSGETTFNLSQEEPAKLIIFVSKKKITKGALNFSITMGDNILSLQEIEDDPFVVSLVDLSNNGLTYSTNSFNLSTDLSALNLEVNYSDNILQITSGPEGMKSGFYRLIVSYKIDNIDYFLNIPDSYIEICDDCTTTADITVDGVSTSRTYYVMTGESSYNGFYKEFPANFRNLFNAIKDEDSWNEINFYFDAEEEFSSISDMDFETILPEGKTVNLYSGDIKFVDNNEWITTFIVGSEIDTDEKFLTFNNLYDVSKVIEKIDYSTKDVKIIVHGYTYESEEITFSKVRSITISGATDINDALSLNDYQFNTDMSDKIDFQTIEGISGLNIDNRYNSIENITIKNLQICKGNGRIDTVSSQWGGLRINFGSNPTGVSLKEIDISNCRFYENKGGSVGGSILIIGDGDGKEISTEIRGCLFENCSSFDSDGGILSIWSELKSVLVDGCSFNGNGKPDIVMPRTSRTSDSNITELTVMNSYFGDNAPTDSNNGTYSSPGLENETNTNIACRTGKLSIGSGNTTKDNIIICFQAGKTINICEDISDEEVSYLLKPIDYKNRGDIDYTQGEPVISVSEGVSIIDVLDKFSMFDSTYTVNETGCINGTINRGSGTEADPYLIGSLDDYDYFSAKVKEYAGGASNPYTNSSVHYKVTADLDFSERTQWSSNPFDDDSDNKGGFYGVFDGDGHTFKGMKGDCPLFHLLDEESIVKNLAIEGDFNYTGSRGYLSFSPFSLTVKGYVSGCSFKGTSTSTTTEKYIFGSPTYKAHFVGCLITLTDGSSIPLHSASSSPGSNITAYSNSTDKTVDELNTEISTWNEKITSKALYPAKAKCEWTFVKVDDVFKIVRNKQDASS